MLENFRLSNVRQFFTLGTLVFLRFVECLILTVLCHSTFMKFSLRQSNSNKGSSTYFYSLERYNISKWHFLSIKRQKRRMTRLTSKILEQILLLCDVSMANEAAAALTISLSSSSPQRSTEYLTLSFLPSQRFTIRGETQRLVQH